MKIALDVDDVLAAWYKAACEYCKVEFKPRNHWGEEGKFFFPYWEDIKADDDFWYNLEVLNEVDFEFDYYITSMPPHLADSRLDWLKRNGFPDKKVYFTQDKISLAEKLGVDVLIDDKPSTIKEFIGSGRHAIHYIPPYSTIKPVSPHYTNDFSKIKNILQQIKKEHYEQKIGGVQNVQTRK